MTVVNASSQKRYAVIGACLVWTALLLQLFLIIQNRVTAVPETVVRFFSYFTVLTNILVALSFTGIFLKGINERGPFFCRPKNLTAIAIYISIVGITYNAILRFQWAPQGWDRVTDELLHLVNPVVYIIFWVKFVPKKNMQWKFILPWAIYPLTYFGYTILRGPSAQWYPYPFMNVTSLGYTKVFFNSAMVTLAFALVAVLYIAIAKRMASKAV
jgi:hypothetical protein